MMNNSFPSSEGFDSHEAQQGYCSLLGSEEDSTGKQSHFSGAEDLGGFDYLWSSYDLCQESFEEEETILPPPDDQRCFSDYLAMDDDMEFNTDDSMAFQFFHKTMPLETDINEKPVLSDVSELLVTRKDKPSPVPLSALKLLNSYRPRHKYCSNGVKVNKLPTEEICRPTEGGCCRELSTEDAMRVAGAYYIQLSTAHNKQGEDDLGMLVHHPIRFMFSSYGDEDINKVELASLLLAATEKVSNQQYDRARKLLTLCQKLSSATGNPVQRVIYYFSKALLERMEKETGRPLYSSKETAATGVDGPDALATPHPIQLFTHNSMPFSQVMQFTSIQTVLDNVASAKRIHLIDFRIRNGIQWTILMQALAARTTSPIEHLKVSAVGMSEAAISETGKRLVSFAETLNLPFDFKAVVVSDLKDLKEHMFELEEEEVVGIYSSMTLSNMLVTPDVLDNFMRLIRKLKPCVVTIMDVQANINSVSFIKRFIEALFYSSAFFDSLDACMDRNDSNRALLESNFFYPGIRNLVAAEGSERIAINVGLGVWRLFLARFGLLEADLNEWSLYQANLLVEQFTCGDSCTLDMDGKSMTVGWKGTPLLFISAWKFH